MIVTLDDIHQKKLEWWDRWGLGRLCDWLEKKTPIRPNHITTVNIGVGVWATMSLFDNQLLTSWLILLMIVVDGFDGFYATRNGLTSKMGEWLDHGGDMFIGIIMLVKSYYYFGEWWILLALGLFVGEWIVIEWNKWGEVKFPERGFIYLFIFGWYWEGLVLQIIIQPVTFINFLVHQYRGLVRRRG